MTLLTLLPAVAVLALIVAVLKASLIYRARAMRAFATEWGLQYIGPTAFRWWGVPPMPKIEPPIEIPFSLNWWPANKLRQVWNVIEGKNEGALVLIFDSFIAVGGRGVYRSFFAFKGELNIFGTGTPSVRVMRTNGWTIVYRSPRFLEVPWTTWSMGTKWLEEQMSQLRYGAKMRA